MKTKKIYHDSVHYQLDDEIVDLDLELLNDGWKIEPQLDFSSCYYEGDYPTIIIRYAKLINIIDK